MMLCLCLFQKGDDYTRCGNLHTHPARPGREKAIRFTKAVIEEKLSHPYQSAKSIEENFRVNKPEASIT